ncbi:MAG: alcohol dehydrogenase, partial [Planctomycetota bacterium]
MKALVLRELKQPLQPEERGPLQPAPGEVVVQLAAAALNRRDYWITQGLYPDIRLPVVLGSDGAGTVVAVGQGVDERWLNRRVIINPGFDWGDDPAVQSERFTILGMPRDGTFAEQVAVPAEQLHDWPE